jgi:hypothetical protein
MTRIIALVAVLGVAIGAVGSLMLGSTLDQAGAAPGCPPKCGTPTATPVPRQRESQIVLSTEYALGEGPSLAVTGGPSAGFRIALDPADYPSGTVFRFEATVKADPGEGCVALFDHAANAPVTGSDVCAANTSNTSSVPLRVRSGPFAIPSGEGEYGLAMSCSQGGSCIAYASRVIAEWTE